MADAPKVYSLYNTGKRHFPLLKGKDGKDRALSPGKSRSDLSEKEFNALKRYPELIDPSKIAPGAESAMANLTADNKALAKRVAELEAENAKLKEDDGKGDKGPKK